MPNYNHFHVDCYLKVTCNILLIIIFTLKYSIDENFYLYLLLSRGRRMKSIILQSFSLYTYIKYSHAIDNNDIKLFSKQGQKVVHKNVS